MLKFANLISSFVYGIYVYANFRIQFVVIYKTSFQIFKFLLTVSTSPDLPQLFDFLLLLVVCFIKFTYT